MFDDARQIDIRCSLSERDDARESGLRFRPVSFRHLLVLCTINLSLDTYIYFCFFSLSLSSHNGELLVAANFLLFFPFFVKKPISFDFLTMFSNVRQ